MTTARVTIAAHVIDAVRRHAEQSDDEECCGLLLGGEEAIVSSVAATNVAPDRRRRYVIDASEYFAAIRHARARQLEVVGSYHSHPRSVPVPSETDRQEAFERFLFLIAGRTPGGFAVRGWRLSGRNFVEVALVRVG